MTETITQAIVDALASEATAVCPTAKLAQLETDIKARSAQPLETQARFLRRLIDTFEAAEVAKYTTEVEAPQSQSRAKSKNENADGSRKRPGKDNPWSKEGWNITGQGKIVRALGEAKAAEIAQAAGCKLGSLHFNPDYV